MLNEKTVLGKEVFKECLDIMEGNMNGVKSVAQDADEMGPRNQPFWWNNQVEDFRKKCNVARKG